MKRRLLSIMFIALIAAGGCAQKPEEQAPSSNELPTSTEPAEVRAETMSSTFKDDDVYVYSEIHYNTPKFSQNGKEMENINAYYTSAMEDIISRWDRTLSPRAHEERERSKAAGGSFQPYSANVDFKILKNSGGYLSVRREINEFTGGAQPSRLIACENWVRKGEDYVRVALGDIFTCDEEEARGQLLDFAVLEANDRIDEIPGLYFENYAEIMQNAWDTNDFYITENGVGIVFQEYTIGPGTTGTQTFEVNYEDLADLKEMKLNK